MSLEVEEAAAGPTALMPEGGAGALVRSVVRVTRVEASARCCCGSLARHAGQRGAVWPAVFHAISAFCNAGFSTFRDNSRVRKGVCRCSR
jgi:trk system potassium uptake protein TrkH